jgi:hypothetical protein
MTAVSMSGPTVTAPCAGIRQARAPPSVSARAAPSEAVETSAPVRVNRGICGSQNRTPSCEIGSSGVSSDANALSAGACVCTVAPTSGRTRMISVWIGYSICRFPVPATTSPSSETRTTRDAVISSKPQPDAFIHTPRPSWSRMAGWPQTMSVRPAAASARQARTTMATESSFI